jgi:carbamoyl-phosphate synthase large subunit
MVKLATEIMLGRTLGDLGYPGGLYKTPAFYAVKVPVFSFNKLHQVDINLGPEMKSTGEVLGIAHNLNSAVYKGLQAAGVEVKGAGAMVATVSDKDKTEAIPVIAEFARLGFKITATEGTAQALEEYGVKVQRVKKLKEGSPNIVDLIREGQVDVVVNTLTQGRRPFSDGFHIRRAAVELNVPCLTSLDTLKVILEVLKGNEEAKPQEVQSLQEYVAEFRQ